MGAYSPAAGQTFPSGSRTGRAQRAQGRGALGAAAGLIPPAKGSAQVSGAAPGRHRLGDKSEGPFHRLGRGGTVSSSQALSRKCQQGIRERDKDLENALFRETVISNLWQA